MIDYLKRLRSPALMAVLAVIGVLVLMSIGHFIVLLMRGTGIPGAARQAGARPQAQDEQPAHRSRDGPTSVGPVVDLGAADGNSDGDERRN